MKTPEKYSILIVEDSIEDYELALRALREAGAGNPVYHCTDGDDALDFLYHKGAYKQIDSSPRPDIIFIDLNLPGTDGFDVLKEIKSDETLRRIPVIILTTSSDPKNIEDCYSVGANSYIRKPAELDEFMRMINSAKNYWFDTVCLPGQ